MHSSLLAFVLVPTVAAAQPDSAETTYYADQSIAVSGVGLALLASGAATEGSHGEDTDLSDALMTAGLLGTLFAPPLVHALHGQGTRTLASLGLRWAGAAMGALAGVQIDPDNDRYIAYGAFGGLVLASIVDASMMTAEETAPSARWQPTVLPTSGGARAGMAWSF